MTLRTVTLVTIVGLALSFLIRLLLQFSGYHPAFRLISELSSLLLYGSLLFFLIHLYRRSSP